MTTTIQQIGQNIRTARRAAGMTQAVLADKIGRTRVSVCNIERGIQDFPISLLPALIAACGVGASAIVGDGKALPPVPQPDILDVRRAVARVRRASALLRSGAKILDEVEEVLKEDYMPQSSGRRR